MRKYLPLLLFIGLAWGKTTIAVLDFEGKGIPESETSILTDRLRNEVFKTDVFVVLERGQMDDVLKEQGFQQSGCISSECAVEVGRMLGVQQMVAGSIGKVGSVYTVSARIFDVETGKILQSANYDHIGDIGQLLLKGISEIVKQLTTGKSSNNQVEISSPTIAADIGNANEKQEITERWSNGIKKTVMIYKGKGINETIEKRGFRKNGQPEYKMNPATNLIYKYHYYKSGKIKREGATNKNVDGKDIYVGLWTWWYENGQKKEIVSISGTQDEPFRTVGLSTEWYENGQKKKEGYYKGLTNGEPKKDGLWIWWYQNGQKKLEVACKDDKEIFLGRWNEDGTIKND